MAEEAILLQIASSLGPFPIFHTSIEIPGMGLRMKSHNFIATVPRSRWVNRKDPMGRNIFSGGFLGLDNIGKAIKFF